MSKKIVPGILRFVSMVFLIFEKGMSKKIVPGILRLVSMLFDLIINVIIFSIKRVIVVFRVCVYAFYGYLKNYYYKKDYKSIFRFASILF